MQASQAIHGGGGVVLKRVFEPPKSSYAFHGLPVPSWGGVDVCEGRAKISGERNGGCYPTKEDVNNIVEFWGTLR